MQPTLNQQHRNSDDLSKYIKKQLSTLLKQVQQTPPKKFSSLKKIHNIVAKSSLPPSQKLSIQRKIKKVQSVIERSQSLQRLQQKLKTQPRPKYEQRLFFQNMILQEKQLNLKNRHLNKKYVEETQKKVNPKEFLNLVDVFENLRTQRLKYEGQIQSLSLKAQKLQRLIKLKEQNQEKYLNSARILQKYLEKKQMLKEIKSQVKIAVKENRKKIVSVLMKKFTETQQM